MNFRQLGQGEGAATKGNAVSLPSYDSALAHSPLANSPGAHPCIGCSAFLGPTSLPRSDSYVNSHERAV